MGTTTFALIVIVIFFGGLIAIGLYFNKKKVAQNSDDNILAGRSAPLLLVSGSLFATWVSSATIMGYAGTGYTLGITGYWSGACFMVATMWIGMWIIPRLRRTGVTTVPELFEHYFGASHRLVALILSLGRDLGVIASISVALATIFSSLFGLSFLWSLTITIGVVIIFTATGGMWAVLATDTIQAVIILIGTIILIPVGISHAGGWSALLAKLPVGHTSPFNAGFSQILGWFLMGCFISLAYQTVLQRGLAAKDDKTAQKSFFYGGLMAIFWYIVPFMCGTVARGLYPDIKAANAFLTLTNVIGPYAGVFFVIALLSSCMSTISSCILTTTSNLTLDLYKRFINPKIDGKNLVWLQRICLVVITVVCAFIGKALPYILELFWVGGRIMASGLAPVFGALILWPKARRAPVATLAAMIAGAASSITAQVYQASAAAAAAGEGGVVFLWSLDPVLAGLPVCFLVLIVGVLIETKNQTHEYLMSRAVKLGEAR